MRLSIRYQLLLPWLTLILGVVGISAWTAAASAQRARRQIEMQVRHIAQTFAQATFPLTHEVLEMTGDLSGAQYLVVHKDGRRTTTLPEKQFSLPHEEVSDDPQRLRFGPRLTVAQRAYFCSGLRLTQGPEAGSVLYILYPESLWQDALWEAVRPSLVLGAFGGLASLVLAVAVAQRLSRRIQGLERRTRQIAAGDFSPMPLPHRNDELRDLSRSVNEMADKLAQLQEAIRKSERLRLLGQVSGGLAHQLRNGVAGARLAVQLHARDCNGHGDSEALDVALRQLVLVEANLKRFLDLGRTDEVQLQPCSLTGLLEEAATLLRPRCRHAHIDLRWQPPAQSVPIHADPAQLRHLFLNLLTNAIDAAGLGGWVEIGYQGLGIRDQASGIRDQGSGIRHQESRDSANANQELVCGHGQPRHVIEILDSGPGPARELEGKLFEPFVTGKPEGVGLGLAVARQVVEAHGGVIDCHRHNGHTCFRIELPVSA